MTLKICGIPFKVKRVKTVEKTKHGIVCGKTLHSKATILIRKGMSKEVEKSTLYHEIVHAILVLIGYNELSDDEVFVQNLSNAIYQMFDLKAEG